MSLSSKTPAVPMPTQILMPGHIVRRIYEFNTSYLLMIRDLAETSASALIAADMPTNVLEAIAKLSTDQIMDLARCGILLCELRVQSADLWESVAAGRIDRDLFIHTLLEGGRK